MNEDLKKLLELIDSVKAASRYDEVELLGSILAVEIRRYIYSLHGFYAVTELKAYIDMKTEKISVEEYRKVVGLD